MDVFESFASFEERDGYSGRGMFGAVAKAAFVTDAHPDTAAGRKLKSRGFSVDSMGLDYIYYRGRKKT